MNLNLLELVPLWQVCEFVYYADISFVPLIFTIHDYISLMFCYISKDIDINILTYLWPEM